MKCPLMYLTDDCLGKECAWWSSDIEACDPTNVSRKLDTLIAVLSQLAKELTLHRSPRI